MEMKIGIFITAFVFATGLSYRCTAQNKSLQVGEAVEMESKILSEKRTLNIYLPEGYKTNDTLGYPVIYLLDGSFNEDYLHVVGLTQFFSMIYGMPPAIVVGIANVDRKRDFTFPTSVRTYKEQYPNTGGSEKFIAFIEAELQPYIEKNYGTGETKYIVGQSLGGLLATEILLKKPYLFSHYLITSPSIWWDPVILKEAPALLSSHKNRQLYISVTVGREGKTMVHDAKALYRLLKKNGPKAWRSRFNYLPKENHATVLHNSLYESFRELFPYRE